jgi:spoIIIJ-associated protein
MNGVESKREIESSGSNVDEAIVAGLEQLGVGRDAVDVEVLDEGSRGLLGIGARQARVRLAVRLEPEPLQEREQEAIPATEPVAADVEIAPSEPSDTIEDELRRVAPVARQTLQELLEKMGIQADIEDYIKPPEDEDDYYKLVLNIKGRDLGVLIGRRGETLDSMQYITRLIVGREVERRVNLVVDVEGYRVRRERSLRKLAERMAERAVTTGRRQVLEPMPAAERRIIHVALRDRTDVMTESIGQDENRKVTISLRESN